MGAAARLAILGFHKIGEPSRDGPSTPWYLGEELFITYFRYLHEHAWEVIDLAAFLRGLREPESLPERAALLTFDDGYRSIRDVALPWLRRFGYPAILFVPTDFIGGWNAFDAGVEPEEAICDWGDLQELQRQGVSIQSHGVSHQPFSWLDTAQQEDELRRSKAVLEAGIGKPVEVFAYPYGDDGVDPHLLAELVKQAGYRAACLYGGGPNPVPILDPYLLPRVAMGPDTDLKTALGDDESC